MDYSFTFVSNGHELWGSVGVNNATIADHHEAKYECVAHHSVSVVNSFEECHIKNFAPGTFRHKGKSNNDKTVDYVMVSTQRSYMPNRVAFTDTCPLLNARRIIGQSLSRFVSQEALDLR